MAKDQYKGGSSPSPDWEVDKDGYRLGRIKGDWEDSLASAAPSHSERNWNHGAQMTEKLGSTDGNIDSQEEVDAVAKWLKENSPGSDDGGGDDNVEETYDPPSEALARARAYVGAKDTADLVGDTTQMKFGVNPVSGETGYETAEGKGIASRFLDNYIDEFDFQMTGKHKNKSAEIAAVARDGGANPAPISEQAPDTMLLP